MFERSRNNTNIWRKDGWINDKIVEHYQIAGKAIWQSHEKRTSSIAKILSGNDDGPNVFCHSVVVFRVSMTDPVDTLSRKPSTLIED